MQDSYLSGSYLGGSELGQLMEAAPQDHQAYAVAPAEDLVQLPGGIILPKRTLLIIGAVIAAAAFYVWQKRRKG